MATTEARGLLTEVTLNALDDVDDVDLDGLYDRTVVDRQALAATIRSSLRDRTQVTLTVDRALRHLTAEEEALFDDLRFRRVRLPGSSSTGPSLTGLSSASGTVRLEQERIRFGRVRQQVGAAIPVRIESHRR